jgi:hypothetical protein
VCTAATGWAAWSTSTTDKLQERVSAPYGFFGDTIVLFPTMNEGLSLDVFPPIGRLVRCSGTVMLLPLMYRFQSSQPSLTPSGDGIRWQRDVQRSDTPL